MKKFIIVFALITGFLASRTNIASAVEYVCLEVIGENVNLRDAPSMKGKVVSQADEHFFVAEAGQIVDNGDRSRWYKVIFAIAGFDGRYYKPPSLDGKKSEYGALYISAKFVAEMPFIDDPQLEYYKKGRPPRYNTGDTVDMTRFHPDSLKAFPIKQAVSLYLAPEKNAPRQNVPAGTKLLKYNGPPDYHGGPNYMNADGVLYYHLDMEDTYWMPFIDENGKILGWCLPGDETSQLKY
jgi:hypothetical protein